MAAIVPRSPVPVFVKVPPFATDEEREGVLAMVRAAQDRRARTGSPARNTVPVQDPRMSTGRGGSRADRSPRAPRRSSRPSARRPGTLPINACRRHLHRLPTPRACLAAGATTVQIYTGLIYEGPAVVGRIAAGLLSRLTSPFGP